MIDKMLSKESPIFVPVSHTIFIKIVGANYLSHPYSTNKDKL